MTQKLAGKVAAVTGGSEGLGLATAQAFVDSGAYVSITGRRQATLDAAAAQLGGPEHVTAVQGGVSRRADLDRLYDAVRQANGDYGATKAAARSFARSWSQDLKERGIRVNVVSPGLVPAPGVHTLVGGDEGVEQIGTLVTAGVPAQRVGRPDEVAAAVLFLAADDSSYTFGSDLAVDGGYAQA